MDGGPRQGGGGRPAGDRSGRPAGVPAARKVLLEPDPAATAAILAEEEAALEESAAEEGCSLAVALTDLPLRHFPLATGLCDEAGEARVRLRHRYVATGAVTGEGLFDAPASFRLRDSGLSEPVPLSDLVVAP